MINERRILKCICKYNQKPILSVPLVRIIPESYFSIGPLNLLQNENLEAITFIINYFAPYKGITDQITEM